MPPPRRAPPPDGGTVVRNNEPGLELGGRDAGEPEVARPCLYLRGRGRLGQGTQVERLNGGQSYIRHLESHRVAQLVAGGRFEATDDLGRLGEPDAIIICVPTPLTRHREPDLQYVEKTTDAVARTLRRGQLVVLESTTYPGTTDEVLLPRLSASGLTVGEDFYLAFSLAFSPEREDPGNAQFTTSKISTVVGGRWPCCVRITQRSLTRTALSSGLEGGKRSRWPWAPVMAGDQRQRELFRKAPRDGSTVVVNDPA
jgi:hypothetical protein